jgi:hypothetical protein
MKDRKETLTIPPPSWPRMTGKRPYTRSTLIRFLFPAALQPKDQVIPRGLYHYEYIHQYGRYLSNEQQMMNKVKDIKSMTYRCAKCECGLHEL